jgi:hypothetical protein
MIKLYSPEDESELESIRKMLDDEGISHTVRHDHFGSVRIGPRIQIHNAKTIVVDEEHFGRAEKLIQDFLQKKQAEGRSWRDRLGMLFWFVPGRKGRDRKRGE